MTWAGYLRVSTDEQELENQRKILTDYFRKRGIDDYRFFEEKESTRKRRPVKNTLYQAAIKGQYEGIAVVRLDRWARSLQELIMDLDVLTQRQTIFVSITDLGELNYQTPAGKLQIQVLGAVAEFERELIRQRTIEGQARARAQGKRIGRPPGSKDKKPRRKSGYHLRYAGGGK